MTGHGVEAARALFHEVYRYGTRLPDDRRPGLYLYGLSLGASASEQSAQLSEVFSDPFKGRCGAARPYPVRSGTR
jgi:uncharacterized membrane protein